MSRIGKKPVLIPRGVDVKLEKMRVFVKGPKGNVAWSHQKGVSIVVAEGKVTVSTLGADVSSRSLLGTTRSIINNMCEGVTKGFTKSLEIQGVGFRAKVEGKFLEMQLGFSHPTRFPIPEGITIKVDKNVMVTVEGVDKQNVGEVAAAIRRFYPPEPYKGKGIRYVGEHVHRKAGKAVA
jgi:large subunit ribosomal protein L6